MVVAKRTYAVGIHLFEILLSKAASQPPGGWKVERVIEASAGGRAIDVPGISDVSAWAEDVAFARACDRVDRWILSNRRPDS